MSRAEVIGEALKELWRRADLGDPIAAIGVLRKRLSEAKPNEVIEYPDEWINNVPGDIRREVADHNVVAMGDEGELYRRQHERSPVWLHGTDSDIRSIDPSKAGSSTGADSAGLAFWGARKGTRAGNETADSYANYAAMGARIEKKVKEADAAGNAGKWDEYDRLITEAEQMEKQFNDLDGRLNGQNTIPFTVAGDIGRIDAGGSSYTDLDDTLSGTVSGSVSDGKDALVIKNFDDAVGLNDKVADHIAVTNPSSVRSVFAARDPAKAKSTNILASTLPAAAGLGLLGQGEGAEAGVITKGGKKIIEAWHGSPHKFDRFDMSKINSGEGAQVYGHGLYFTDTEDVAKGYREAVSQAHMKRNGHVNPSSTDYLIDGQRLSKGHPDYLAADIARIAKSDGGELPEDFDDWLDSELGARLSPYDDADAVEGRVREFINRDIVEDDAVGALYKTHIDVDPDSLLDWDKPLSEQPVGALEKLKDFVDEQADYVERYPSGGLGEPLGVNVYSSLSRRLGGAKQAGEELNRRGIPGLRYLDGDSRGVGSGSHNYVMFDDAPISIVERGNANPALLGTIAAGGTAGAAAPRTAQELSGYSDAVMGGFMQALDYPARGIAAVGRVYDGLMRGEGARAYQNAIDSVRAPSEMTMRGIGERVAESTGSPALGAAAYAIPQVLSPL